MEGPTPEAMTEEEQKAAIREAMKAEKEAAKEASKAEKAAARKAAKEAAKAERIAIRKAAKEEREAKAQAAKAEREAKKGAVQNNVRQPSIGTKTREVWDAADSITNDRVDGTYASFSDVKAALPETFNQNTIRVQYTMWKRFHGFA